MPVGAIILGAISAATAIAGLVQSGQDEAPLDNIGQQEDNSDVYKKYERLYSELGEKVATKEGNLGIEAIERSRVGGQAQINELFGDPTTRFRTGMAVNNQADINSVNAGLSADKLRLEITKEAANMGISYTEYKRRLWNDMVALSVEKQRLYNERQVAWGGALQAGLSNITESTMDIEADASAANNDPDSYPMSKQAYRQEKKNSGAEDFPGYKQWKYEKFGN